MIRRRRKRAKPSSLMITPMIDMFTVILIFLIVSYAPEQSKIKKSKHVEVPAAQMTLNKVPSIQIEVTETYISVNGTPVNGLLPADRKAGSWSKFKAALEGVRTEKNKDEPVLVIADKATAYQYVDRTVGHVAAAGFSEVYFLTEDREEGVE